MNDHRFDRWSRRLASAGSRRQALHLLARSALGLGLAGKVVPARADDPPDDLPAILHPLLGSETMVVDTGYTPDRNPSLKNPERGIYYWSSTPASYGCDDDDPGPMYHTIVARWLYLGKDQSTGTDYCNEELVWNGHHKEGTTPRLNKYADTLVSHRKAGTKVVFRPRYDNPDDDTYKSNSCHKMQAEGLDLQLRHIEAVAKMLREFKDVVAFIEAGYLGSWGEWNTEKGPAPLLDSRADREAVLRHILEKYDEAGLLQHIGMRRTVFAAEAIALKPNARVGIYDDCFLSSDNSSPPEEWDDTGTYHDFPGSLANVGGKPEAQVLKWRAWAQKRAANISFGGETCPADGNERWRYCDNMIGVHSEPRLVHMSYLNARDARREWCTASPPCYDEIRSKLGYRFVVKRVEYTRHVAPGERLLVRILVENTGWARLHKPRQAKLVLRNGGAPHVVEDRYVTGGAVADWAPGQTVTISVDAPAPTRVGTYQVRLWIPDPDFLAVLDQLEQPEDYASTQINYAVKLATKRGTRNVFDDATGENDLGVSIIVQ